LIIQADDGKEVMRYSFSAKIIWHRWDEETEILICISDDQKFYIVSIPLNTVYDIHSLLSESIDLSAIRSIHFAIFHDPWLLLQHTCQKKVLFECIKIKLNKSFSLITHYTFNLSNIINNRNGTIDNPVQQYHKKKQEWHFYHPWNKQTKLVFDLERGSMSTEYIEAFPFYTEKILYIKKVKAFLCVEKMSYFLFFPETKVIDYLLEMEKTSFERIHSMVPYIEEQFRNINHNKNETVTEKVKWNDLPKRYTPIRTIYKKKSSVSYYKSNRTLFIQDLDMLYRFNIQDFQLQGVQFNRDSRLLSFPYDRYSSKDDEIVFVNPERNPERKFIFVGEKKQIIVGKWNFSQKLIQEQKHIDYTTICSGSAKICQNRIFILEPEVSLKVYSLPNLELIEEVLLKNSDQKTFVIDNCNIFIEINEEYDRMKYKPCDQFKKVKNVQILCIINYKKIINVITVKEDYYSIWSNLYLPSQTCGYKNNSLYGSFEDVVTIFLQFVIIRTDFSIEFYHRDTLKHYLSIAIIKPNCWTYIEEIELVAIITYNYQLEIWSVVQRKCMLTIHFGCHHTTNIKLWHFKKHGNYFLVLFRGLEPVIYQIHLPDNW